ncbi:MAG TPA: GrpB family protein [Tepidisphaeraceae bacterium]|jgi:GrpB-like predicted nucleotidyltransferase (UPF0157 family)|nr:GrpB family protein [Tepidisphaeraceae bacterium]
MPPETFLLSPYDHADMIAAFEALKNRLQTILPASADIQHIGATSIPGCLTKADLDLCVRVAPEHFAACDAALATHFPRNTGSVRTESFSAFHAQNAGIQLVVTGSSLDVFTRFRDLLCNNPSLLHEYNHLKQRYNGKPMTEYRKAKDAFIESALSSV